MSDKGTSLPTARDRSAFEALSPVLQKFLTGVLAGEMPTKVVRRIRPHLKRPEVLASKWLARPDVQAARAEIARNAVENVGITQEMIAREIGRIAFGDPRKLFDEHGNMRPVHELDDETAAIVAGIEIMEREIEGKHGKKAVKRKIKYRRWDKRQALRDLAEMAGAAKGVEPSGTIFNIQINF